eukprot:TRINITY_DN9062_c0_g1_i2.p1 TRINITY_DN9062_c0_g1~~TRINITY_DN9062_c0_g1_i2.p1  ORF type:complete len:415 (+),score=113.84 TRINITY_DN9062_c0_g1_i2:99-1343(+)
MDSRQSSMMSREEEEELDAMVRQRRSRGMAFYGRDPPTSRHELQMVGEQSPPPAVPVRVCPNPCHSGSSPSDRFGSSLQDGHPPIYSRSSRLNVGYADTIGRRPTMEDEIVIKGRLRGRDDEDFVAVFDGHGGAASSEFSAHHLFGILESKLDEFEDPPRCLKDAFIEVNTMIRQQNVSGGTTAIVVFFQRDQCYVANAGDSRAVLYQHSKVIRMSKDHKPDDPEEEKRIVEAGGIVTRIVAPKLGKTISRVNGMLAVSRALGDIFLQPYVSPEPDITQFRITGSRDEFVILACDGLWDVMSDEEACQIASSEIHDPETAASKLRDAAFKKSSTDNISVVVIAFDPIEDAHQDDDQQDTEPDGSDTESESESTRSKDPSTPSKRNGSFYQMAMKGIGIFAMGATMVWAYQHWEG